jgi:hypothetical protein
MTIAATLETQKMKRKKIRRSLFLSQPKTYSASKERPRYRPKRQGVLIRPHMKGVVSL